MPVPTTTSITTPVETVASSAPVDDTVGVAAESERVEPTSSPAQPDTTLDDATYDATYDTTYATTRDCREAEDVLQSASDVSSEEYDGYIETWAYCYGLDLDEAVFYWRGGVDTGDDSLDPEATLLSMIPSTIRSSCASGVPEADALAFEKCDGGAFYVLYSLFADHDAALAYVLALGSGPGCQSDTVSDPAFDLCDVDPFYTMRFVGSGSSIVTSTNVVGTASETIDRFLPS